MATASRTVSKPRFADRICNLEPSRGTDLDWSMQDALASGAILAAGPLPASIDLRKPWWKIGNQLTTGSCVGWASADGVMRYHLVAANRLQANELLSPRFVWMASKETDELTARPETFIETAGTTLKTALDVLRKYGAVTETMLPLRINTLMYPGPQNTFYAAASTRRLANYFNLRKDIGQWKSWLVNNGPILAGFTVDDTWLNAANTAGNLDSFNASTARGGHAVCIVGYSGDRFIIRNSWGPTWGDKGFGYASSAYIAAAFFDESYGITL